MKNFYVLFCFILLSSSTYSQMENVLVKVFFKSKEVGWVCTGWRDDKVYKTINGGLSWFLIDSIKSIVPSKFFNENNGIMEFGWKTFDGGLTWKRYFTKDVYRFHFLDENLGYGISYGLDYANDTIFRTIDGGLTWDFAGEIPNAFKLWVINSENVIVIDRDNRIYKTTNRGLTWSQQISAFPQNSLFYLSDISFSDSITGFITGFEDSNYPNTMNRTGIIKTTDGGKNWFLDTLGVYGSSIKFIDSLTGFMWGQKSFDRTDNNGMDWTSVYVSDSGYTFFFLDNLIGFAVGYNYFFAKTTDGGYTWTQLPFNTSAITSQEENNLPLQYSLTQNYPNPFNPSTKIKYTIPKQGLVTLKIYDVLGKELLQLVNEEKPSGDYEVEFNGSSLSSGIYFYKIQAGEFLDTKKMVLMK